VLTVEAAGGAEVGGALNTEMEVNDVGEGFGRGSNESDGLAVGIEVSVSVLVSVGVDPLSDVVGIGDVDEELSAGPTRK